MRRKLLSDDTTNATYYFYDNNGNTISSHEETLEAGSEPTSYYLMLAGHGEGDTYAIYTYDVFNQMLSVSDNDSVSGFSYNGEGLRIGKTVTEDDETTTSVFAYEYSKAVLELDENGDETAYNVYGGDMLISRTTTSDGTLYYLYNGHGDVVQLTDSNGTVVMTYDYDAFGVVTVATGTITNSYMFCGYMYDEETGLFYVSSRYYDPVVARFMSADTYLGQQNDPLSLNLYTYCYNEPLMNYDPTGHKDAYLTDLVKASGGTVSWNEKTREATATVNGITKTFYIDDYYVQDGHIVIDNKTFNKLFTGNVKSSNNVTVNSAVYTTVSTGYVNSTVITRTTSVAYGYSNTTEKSKVGSTKNTYIYIWNVYTKLDRKDKVMLGF